MHVYAIKENVYYIIQYLLFIPEASSVRCETYCRRHKTPRIVNRKCKGNA